MWGFCEHGIASERSIDFETWAPKRVTNPSSFVSIAYSESVLVQKIQRLDGSAFTRFTNNNETRAAEAHGRLTACAVLKKIVLYFYKQCSS